MHLRRSLLEIRGFQSLSAEGRDDYGLLPGDELGSTGTP